MAEREGASDDPPEYAPASARLAELRDVNERLLIASLREQELAAALDAERAQLAVILDSIGDAVVVVDQAGTPVRSNAAYDALFGGTGDAVALRGANGAPLPPHEMPFVRAARGETFSLQASLTAEDGTRRWLEANGQPAHNGGVRWGVVVIRDITVQSQRRLLQDEFLATISHNLQTPLTAIRAGLGLVERGVGARLTPEEQELLAAVRRNAERLRTRIGDLLTANQIDAGAVRVGHVALDLRSVVLESVAEVQPLLRDKNQRLEVDLAVPLPVVGDPYLLDQMVRNLLANAHRHTPPGTRIEVSGQVAAGQVHLAVRDDGPGIPAADLETIFVRFHRLDASSGSGLGLAIARHVVELHGGRLWAESHAGAGAIFHAALPLADGLMEGGAV